MQDQINQYSQEIAEFAPANPAQLEEFRIRYLGTKGIVKDLFEQFKAVSPEEKSVLGKVLNQFKQLAEAKYNEYKEGFDSELKTEHSELDLTLPGEGFEVGSRHQIGRA